VQSQTTSYTNAHTLVHKQLQLPVSQLSERVSSFGLVEGETEGNCPLFIGADLIQQKFWAPKFTEAYL
jgi:hypothetical protein